jgi:hypothetical protein
MAVEYGWNVEPGSNRRLDAGKDRKPPPQLWHMHTHPYGQLCCEFCDPQFRVPSLFAKTPPLKREVFWQETDWKEFSCGRSRDFRIQLLRVAKMCESLHSNSCQKASRLRGSVIAVSVGESSWYCVSPALYISIQLNVRGLRAMEHQACSPHRSVSGGPRDERRPRCVPRLSGCSSCRSVAGSHTLNLHTLPPSPPTMAARCRWARCSRHRLAPPPPLPRRYHRWSVPGLWMLQYRQPTQGGCPHIYAEALHAALPCCREVRSGQPDAAAVCARQAVRTAVGCSPPPFVRHDAPSALHSAEAFQEYSTGMSCHSRSSMSMHASAIAACTPPPPSSGQGTYRYGETSGAAGIGRR